MNFPSSIDFISQDVQYCIWKDIWFSLHAMAVGSLESQPQWEVNNQTQGAKKKKQTNKHQRKTPSF